PVKHTSVHQQYVADDRACITRYCPLRANLFDHVHRLLGADTFIDVEAVRLATYRKYFGTQLAENVGRDMVSRSMGSIHHDGKPRERQFIREGALAELDISPRRVINAASTTQLCRVNAVHLFMKDGLDFRFDFIG